MMSSVVQYCRLNSAKYGHSLFHRTVCILQKMVQQQNLLKGCLQSGMLSEPKDIFEIREISCKSINTL